MGQFGILLWLGACYLVENATFNRFVVRGILSVFFCSQNKSSDFLHVRDSKTEKIFRIVRPHEVKFDREAYTT